MSIEGQQFTAEPRPYRRLSALLGQTSPPAIAHAVVMQVVGSRVADIGCGSGVTGYLLRAAWHFTAACQVEGIDRPELLVGVDWSASTLAAVAEHDPYDELVVAAAAELPLADDVVDTAISMENLEHLLPADIPHALAELARISRRRIVISTPAPWFVVNDQFLETEAREATTDPVPMGYAEFMNLLGQLHKSTVTPRQMAAAGFHTSINRLGSPTLEAGSVIYVADSDAVDVGALGPVVGVAWSSYPEPDGTQDWRSRYLEAVQDVRRMGVSRREPLARRASVVLKALREF